MFTLKPRKKDLIKGLCADCVFVAAQCAEDEVTDCPYFSKESAMCEASSNSVLGEGWRDARNDTPEYQNCIIWVDGGNGSVDGGYIFEAAFINGIYFSPDGESHKPIAFMKRPSKPAFA